MSIRYVSVTSCDTCDRIWSAGIREAVEGDVMIARGEIPNGIFLRCKRGIKGVPSFMLNEDKIIRFEYTCQGCRPQVHGSYSLLVVEMCDHCYKQAPVGLRKPSNDVELVSRKCEVPDDLMAQYPPLASQAMSAVVWKRCPACVPAYADSVDSLVRGYIYKAVTDDDDGGRSSGALTLNGSEHFRSTRKGRFIASGAR